MTITTAAPAPPATGAEPTVPQQGAALLSQAAGYRGNPGAKHMYLPIEKAHFTRWLALFGQTVDALFAGENAAEMKVRALKMGEMFQAKIASGRANGGLSIL